MQRTTAKDNRFLFVLVAEKISLNSRQNCAQFWIFYKKKNVCCRALFGVVSHFLGAESDAALFNIWQYSKALSRYRWLYIILYIIVWHMIYKLNEIASKGVCMEFVAKRCHFWCIDIFLEYFFWKFLKYFNGPYFPKYFMKFHF